MTGKQTPKPGPLENLADYIGNEMGRIHAMGDGLTDIADVPRRSTDITNPGHYRDGWSNGAEVIDITEHLSFNRGNAIKYLARAGRKPGAQELDDLRKSAWYVQREIERVSND